ncbi:MAG: DUF3299 domain-containing protein [Planctomycetota bacterium]
MNSPLRFASFAVRCIAILSMTVVLHGGTLAAQQPDSRKQIEPRPSSEAQLAKGIINFDDLRMDVEKDAAVTEDDVTDRIKEKISGRTVKLKGYMLPSTVFQNKNIKAFVLVRDNLECCFGPGAAIFDCVYINMVGDNSAEFKRTPVTVEGRFEVDMETYKYPGGKGPRGASHLAIFKMSATSVK